MMSAIRPEPGEWYRDTLSGNVFQVVGVDEEEQSVDVQFADGAVEEFAMDDWDALTLERCEQPEDWAGPFDDLEADEIGLPESTAESHGAEVPMERALLDIEERRSGDLEAFEE
jgi:hypothetical protein